MAQQLLHGAEIGTGIQHVGGKSVAERVHPETVTANAVE
jgi:hypothetical protein